MPSYLPYGGRLGMWRSPPIIWKKTLPQVAKGAGPPSGGPAALCLCFSYQAQIV